MRTAARRLGVRVLAPATSILWLVACSDGSTAELPGTGGDDASAGTSGETAPGPDDGDGATAWETLVSGSWSLEPQSEDPDHCVKITLEQDIFVKAIRPIHPVGTHHTFVALSDSADGDGCQQAVATGQLVYGAGLGTEGLDLPAGVAMKLPAGKVLNLSLHIYNPSDSPIAGTSGMEIQTMDAQAVSAEVSALLAGPLMFELPPAKRTVIRHTCTVSRETTAFALFPHMHQLGQHFKTTVVVDGEESIIHDAPYSFDEQFQLSIDPIEFRPGDRIISECTFDNPAPNTVTFGESTDQEMCFSMFFSYPAGPTLCADGDVVVLE